MPQDLYSFRYFCPECSAPRSTCQSDLSTNVPSRGTFPDHYNRSSSHPTLIFISTEFFFFLFLAAIMILENYLFTCVLAVTPVRYPQPLK